MALRSILRYGQRIVGFIGMVGSLRHTSKATAEAEVSRRPWKCNHSHPFSWLGNFTPCFGINGKQIQVLYGPGEFFDTLKQEFKQAKKRIVIASLYLGTGSQEQELVDSIRQSCQEAQCHGWKDFEVHILLDFQRGSRGSKSSRTMLMPLVREFDGMVHVHLFHTPNLRGILKSLLPERLDELVSLNHMKVYLADDNFVMSGANLGETYFTNRQDRYALFTDCKELADFFTNLVMSVASSSFLLKADNSVVLSPGCRTHPFEDPDGGKEYRSETREKILNIIRKTPNSCRKSGVDTWVYPLIQMGPFDIDDDETVTNMLFRSAKCTDRILLASGYFNLTNKYMDIIVDESDATFKLLMASPEANGFYGAKNLSGYVPLLYVHTAKCFYDKVCREEQSQRIELYDYYYKDWSFHGKGIWFYSEKESLPSMSIIGSSNFGYRSVFRDLECQVAIVTKNTYLQEQLKREHEQLFEHATELTEETFSQENRQVPLWLKCLSGAFKTFF